MRASGLPVGIRSDSPGQISTRSRRTATSTPGDPEPYPNPGLESNVHAESSSTSMQVDGSLLGSLQGHLRQG